MSVERCYLLEHGQLVNGYVTKENDIPSSLTPEQLLIDARMPGRNGVLGALPHP